MAKVKATLLACPSCGDADMLGTLENYVGTAWASVGRLGTGEVAINWAGGAEIAWDSAETIGIRCGSCDWEYLGGDWADQLINAGEVEVSDEPVPEPEAAGDANPDGGGDLPG